MAPRGTPEHLSDCFKRKCKSALELCGTNTGLGLTYYEQLFETEGSYENYHGVGGYVPGGHPDHTGLPWHLDGGGDRMNDYECAKMKAHTCMVHTEGLIAEYKDKMTAKQLADARNARFAFERMMKSWRAK